LLISIPVLFPTHQQIVPNVSGGAHLQQVENLRFPGWRTVKAAGCPHDGDTGESDFSGECASQQRLEMRIVFLLGLQSIRERIRYSNVRTKRVTLIMGDLESFQERRNG
jgi:hypothetical protein